MKRLVLAALGALFISQAQAETVWVGNAFVTAANQPTCGTAASVGDYSRLVYQPAGSAMGNTGDSYLAYVSTRSSLTLDVLNNTFRAGINYGALAVGSHLTFASYIAGITAWSLTPSVISASTSHYTLNATFANFYDVAGCTVSIKADLERAP